MMSNEFAIEYEGHRIEVEASSDFKGITRYDLIVDNERVDKTQNSLGRCTLRGKLEGDGEPTPFVIRIKTGIFRVRCSFDANGKTVPLRRR